MLGATAHAREGTGGELVISPLDRARAMLFASLVLLIWDVALGLNGLLSPLTAVTVLGPVLVVAGVAATLMIIFMAEEMEVDRWSNTN